MFDTHERIFQKLAESGHKEFSTEMIKSIIDEVEDEEVDMMYAEWLKREEAQAEERAQWRTDENAIDRIERSQQEAEQYAGLWVESSTSWEEAAEGLDDIPKPQHSHNREMEM